jgi:NNP family nitrate/nitrite transporter-like MFS transporter
MNMRDFLKSGHTPTLVCALLYFDISFMAWMLFGALAQSLVTEMRLSESLRGVLLAVPILSGALLRLVLGPLGDRRGNKRVALLGLALTVIPLTLGGLWATAYWHMLVVGVLLGIAGASFAVALPLAGRWYPPKYQGLAMGIAGAGNSGTAFATFFAPRLAEAFGDWRGVFLAALVPVAATMVVVWRFAKESPSPPTPRPLADYAKLVAEPDTWWVGLFYAVTFGGFVGLCAYSTSYFTTEFQLSPVTAGSLATLCVLAGSFVRPLGGYLADRLGGARVLVTILVALAGLFAAQAYADTLTLAACQMVVILGCLGMGNGAVFQLVPQRFPRDLGLITGIVGAAGGVGGFFLPIVLGVLKEETGRLYPGFLCLAGVCLAASVAVAWVARGWEGVYVAAGGKAVAASR